MPVASVSDSTMTMLLMYFPIDYREGPSGLQSYVHDFPCGCPKVQQYLRHAELSLKLLRAVVSKFLARFRVLLHRSGKLTLLYRKPSCANFVGRAVLGDHDRDLRMVLLASSSTMSFSSTCHTAVHLCTSAVGFFHGQPHPAYRTHRS